LIKKYQKAFSLIEISIVILVIGILIAGISQAIEMFSEASLKSARNLSKSSRISRIDDLSLWLDATSDKAFDKEKDDGSTISMWKDTNPRSTAQIIGNPVSSMPTYTLSAINGLPTASFKKTSSNCMTIPSQSFVNNSEDFTLYLIFSPTTLDDGIILEKNNATAAAFPFSLELFSGSYKFSIKNSANTISVTSPKKANINNPNLISLSRIKGSQIEIVIDGVSATQSDTLTSSTLNNAELAIGCRNVATPLNFVSGDIGEIAFFDRNLSVKEKSDSEDYFYKKWKMKKYEGMLANSEDPSSSPCAVPSGANTISTITLVQPSSEPQNISCKTGYSGTPKYTCINGFFNIVEGACQFDGCEVSTSASETYVGYSVGGVGNVNLRNLLGQENVIFGASGIYSSFEGYGGYGYGSPPSPAFSVRWKCNMDRTMLIDIERDCVIVYINVWRYIKHGSGLTEYFMQSQYPQQGYCCAGNMINQPCSWPTNFIQNYCYVPESFNLAIDTTPPSNTSQAIACKNNYIGTPKYTCIEGIFAITEGYCDIACTIPLDKNINLTKVDPTKVAQNIACKNGFSGSPTYTCIGGVFSMTGSCTLPCNVPADKNIVATTVQSTSTAQTANCKTEYIGEPQYTCINGVFAIVSGACSLPCADPSSSGSCDSSCTVPPSANMDQLIVQPTANALGIGCKSGYTGTPTYTCINGNFSIASGTCCEIASGNCQSDGCVVPDCAIENYEGYSPSGISSCINLRNILDQDNVSYGASGIYSNNLSGYNEEEGITLPAFSLRWKCNYDGAMSIDIERDCPWLVGLYAGHPQYEYVYLNHHGDTSSDYYIDDTFTEKSGYCCGGSRVSNIGTCPWPNW
jgi:prepilin-type N-terminal cleavage/methylation domain-containing protein